MKQSIDKSLKLSSVGRISAYMCIAIFSAQTNANIKASGDTKTDVSTKNGVDIVNIAAPNTQGLSHNQFSDFNVSKQGAVLNNSLHDGQSVLAGNLSANQNLHESTAKVILNEVVSSNESLLLGKQEVFGMAADYVLANPNGITCDGCGFINTPRASLVVGKPIVDKDVLANFLLDNDKTLAVKNTVTANSIDLLAPVVMIDSNVNAEENINVILGHGQVAYAGLKTSALPNEQSENAKQKDVVIDSKVLGSMQAGRIRIHSHDDRANLAVSVKANAKKDINIDMAGDTAIQNSQLKSKNIDIAAKNLLINGKKNTKVISDERKEWDVKGKWFSKVNHLKTNKIEQQQYSQSELDAKNINITAQQDAKIIATKVTADKVNITADNFDAHAETVATRTQSDFYKKSKGLWYNQVENKVVDNTLVQNDWNVAKKLTIKATDTSLSAVKVKAMLVDLTGVNSLSLNAGKVTDTVTNTNSYKNETVKLKTGDHVKRETQTSVLSSNIDANKIILTSHGKAKLSGSELKANTIKAGGRGSLNIGIDVTETFESDIESYKYWGGIGGGNTQGTSKTKSTHKGTRLNANNITLNNESGVTVTGSELTANNSLMIRANSGDVTIDHVKNNVSTLNNKRHGTAFNITDKSQKVQTSEDTTLTSTLDAKNLVIKGKNIALKGGQLSADNLMVLRAYNKLTTDVADAQTTKVTEKYVSGFKGYTKADGKKLKGIAGARLQGVKTVKGTGTGVGTKNTLSAKTVILEAKNTELKGSKLTADNLKVTADKLTVGAGEVKTASEFNNKDVTGAGVYVSGSLKKVALGTELGHEQTNKAKDTFTAQQSELTVANGVRINVNDINLVGAKITTPQDITLTAKNLTTEAAHDRVVTTEVNGFGGVSLEAYAKLDPAVGANLSLDGEGNKKVTTTKTAKVTELRADKAALTAENKLVDSGTRYDMQNNLHLTANEYEGKAAENSTVSINHYGKAGTDLDVYTEDFSSVTFELGAHGKYQYEQDGKATAVKGNINAKNINITAKDKLGISHNMQAQNINLTAKNAVAITQDNNRQWKTHGGFDASGSIGVQYIPPKAFKPEFDVKAGMNYLKVNDTQAVVSNIDATNVTLKADNTAGIAGANMTTTDLTVQANNVAYDAAYDSHKATGVDLSGQLSMKLGIKKGKVSKGGAGIGGDIGVVNEAATTAHGGIITAKNISMTADSDQALAVVGADINTDSLTLTNSKGDVEIIAGKSTVYKGNWGLGAHVGAEASKKSVKTIGVGAHLDIDTDNSVYHDQGSIHAKQVTLTSGKDTNLQTNLKADKLKVNTGGDLNLSSARDKTGKFLFKVGADLGYRQIFDGKKFSAKDVAKSINKGMIFGVKAAGNINVNIDHRKETQVADVQVNDMVLNLGSDKMTINAAKVASQNTTGMPATVVKTDNKDFIHNIGFDFEAKTPSPIGIVSSLIKGEKIESPVKADGRFKWEDYTSSAELNTK